tara:strand:- start:1305 stop:1748 length:444 start_codon:yes stop_codon:yes gene_type:complete
MAYIIYTNENKLVGMADNDNDRDNYTGIELLKAITISDADYLKVKNTEAIIGDYDAVNSQHTVEDIEIVPIENADELNNHLESIKVRLNSFLKIPANQPKLIWTRCNDYNTYLKSLDTTSLTYPINSTWEKYCSDNSIVYMNSLQIC